MEWLARQGRTGGGAGLACATGAVALGIVYLGSAGAPGRMIGMNLAAWLVGLAAYATVTGPRWRIDRLQPWLVPGLALTLLATALAGTAVDGASRWVVFGPLTLQTSLVLLPAMAILFARRPLASGAAGLAVAGLALALQPDRAMAGALALSLAVLALRRRSLPGLIALAAALAGFAAALARPDRLPAVPYVDQVFYSSFTVHPVAGLAVLIGAGLMLLPPLLRLRRGADPDAALVFGAMWLAILAAAALGNYPTPLVGFGGSAIVGYLLSLGVLMRGSAAVAAPTPTASPLSEPQDERSLAASLA